MAKISAIVLLLSLLFIPLASSTPVTSVLTDAPALEPATAILDDATTIADGATGIIEDQLRCMQVLRLPIALGYRLDTHRTADGYEFVQDANADARALARQADLLAKPVMSLLGVVGAKQNTADLIPEDLYEVHVSFDILKLRTDWETIKVDFPISFLPAAVAGGIPTHRCSDSVVFLPNFDALRDRSYDSICIGCTKDGIEVHTVIDVTSVKVKANSVASSTLSQFGIRIALPDLEERVDDAIELAKLDRNRVELRSVEVWQNSEAQEPSIWQSLLKISKKLV